MKRRLLYSNLCRVYVDMRRSEISQSQDVRFLRASLFFVPFLLKTMIFEVFHGSVLCYDHSFSLYAFLKIS